MLPWSSCGLTCQHWPQELSAHHRHLLQLLQLQLLHSLQVWQGQGCRTAAAAACLLTPGRQLWWQQQGLLLQRRRLVLLVCPLLLLVALLLVLQLQLECQKCAWLQLLWV